MIVWGLQVLAIASVFSAVIAVGLIVFDRPKAGSATGGLDFSNATSAVIKMPTPHKLPMRDGFGLTVWDYPNASGPLVVMVHGSGWNDRQYNGLAPVLQAHSHVVVVDLRGHGRAPGRRGDIDYIGQFEDDLNDVITSQAVPGQKVVLLGHSSGGGLVVRFAGGMDHHVLDGAVLLAPFLLHNAPTTRKKSGGWAQPLTRRIIGLTMLNAVGITVLNHLKVITFNMPRDILDGALGDTATTAYSYRLNTSYAPRRNYLKDITALPPFLLIAGQEDEAFVAEGYVPLMQPVTDTGQYLLVPGQRHLGIVDAPATAAAIGAYLDAV